MKGFQKHRNISNMLICKGFKAALDLPTAMNARASIGISYDFLCAIMREAAQRESRRTARRRSRTGTAGSDGRAENSANGQLYRRSHRIARINLSNSAGMQGYHSIVQNRASRHQRVIRRVLSQGRCAAGAKSRWIIHLPHKKAAPRQREHLR